MVFGRDSRRLPETFKAFSLERQPMELGSALSWLECTSSTTKFSSLAVSDSGMLCSPAHQHKEHRKRKQRAMSKGRGVWKPTVGLPVSNRRELWNAVSETRKGHINAVRVEGNKCWRGRKVKRQTAVMEFDRAHPATGYVRLYRVRVRVTRA
ncbi:hypothetical protein GW17_00004031 [Ensete ventricosum]|nr:hypothetical protein GW17_00004031 [Ensete ventricosum]